MNSILLRCHLASLFRGRATSSTRPVRTYCSCSVQAKSADYNGVKQHESQSTRTLRVSEIFKSIQGEGPFCGVPSIFLRLGMCNLSCVWCDTSYTWLFDEERLQKVRRNIAQYSTRPVESYNLKIHDKSSELQRHSIAEVSRHISSLALDSVRNIVITGGEPLLHKKHLLYLIPAFVDKGFSIEFETNGTISPELLEPFADNIHFNVSPKLSNSLQPHNLRINLDTMHQCLQFPSSVLKLIVDSPDDLNEVVDIVKLTGVPPSRVYLMPQGSNSDEIEERGRWLVDICIQHGFHYSHRLHIELWGSKRGV